MGLTGFLTVSLNTVWYTLTKFNILIYELQLWSKIMHQTVFSIYPIHSYVDLLKDLFDKFYPMLYMVRSCNKTVGAWEKTHFNVLAVSLNCLLKFICMSFVGNMLFAILLGKLAVRCIMVFKFLLIENIESNQISCLFRSKQRKMTQGLFNWITFTLRSQGWL